MRNLTNSELNQINGGDPFLRNLGFSFAKITRYFYDAMNKYALEMDKPGPPYF